MATIVKTSSGTWKVLIHKTGWPSTAKSFRTKRVSTQAGEHKKAQVIIQHLGKYSLAALNAEIVAKLRDTRLVGARLWPQPAIDPKNRTVYCKPWIRTRT